MTQLSRIERASCFSFLQSCTFGCIETHANLKITQANVIL